MKRAILWLVLLLVAILGYLATGITAVAPGEAAVVIRLGRARPEPWGPGLHWGWPAGFDRVEHVRPGAVRDLAVGLAGLPGPFDAPGAGEFLTGDLNLLRARAVVQYRVADPVRLLRTAGTTDSRAVEPLLSRLAESSLARALSRRGIDAALVAARPEVAREAASSLAEAVAADGLGLEILGVSLTDARPPAEVQPDFDAAQAARSARDRRTREARTYEATTLAAARAEAAARLERARAVVDRAVALARARADRFLALQAEADRSPALTARRLYLDALRELLPRVRRKLVLAPEDPIDLSLLGAATPPDPPAPGSDRP